MDWIRSDRGNMTTGQNPFAGTNERLREQVLEVIFRQAMAGAPWREICEGPMRVNNIDPAEVESLISYSRRTAAGGDVAITWDEQKRLEQFWADWQGVLNDRSTVDRARTSKAIEAVYQMLNHKPPVVLFCDSPLQLALFPMLFKWVQQQKPKAVTPEVVQVVNQVMDGLNVEQKESFWNAFESDLDLINSRLASKPVGIPIGSQSDMHVWRGLAGKLRPRLMTEVSPDLYAALRFERNRTNSAMLFRRLYVDIPAAILNRSELAALVPFMFHPQASIPSNQAGMAMQSDCRGIFDVVDLLRYSFKPEIYDDAARQELETWLELGRCAFAYRMFDNVCIVAARPSTLVFNPPDRLHNDEGPAATFSDGYKVYAINGVVIPQEVVENPSSITYLQIEQTANVEVRHVLISRYGLERFIKDSDARLIQSDKFGKLFRKETAGRDPVVMVQVENSTLEPDGTRKSYFLMVPPTVRTAHEAVAWTFGLQVENYKPDIET